MSLQKPFPKGGYMKKSTRDFSHIKHVVDPELKKRNDKLFKALVDNLNRNTLKQDEEPNSK
tara:strand:- start:247 stop:429 length:183 start_codon:yes stop_codon:yes gene_type:complete